MGEHIFFPLSPTVDYILLGYPLYGFKNLTIVKDEISDEVDLPQEILHGFLFHGIGNLCDCPNFVRIYLDPTFGNDVSHHVTLRHCEDALLGIQGYPIFPTSLENLLKMAQVV